MKQTILKLAKQDPSFRKKMIQKLAKKIVLPQEVKDDLVDCILSAQNEGREKFLKKYLKMDGLNKKIDITYVGSEAWTAEIQFTYIDENEEEGEFTLNIDMGNPKFK